MLIAEVLDRWNGITLLSWNLSVQAILYPQLFICTQEGSQGSHIIFTLLFFCHLHLNLDLPNRQPDGTRAECVHIIPANLCILCTFSSCLSALPRPKFLGCTLHSAARPLHSQDLHRQSGDVQPSSTVQD